MHRLDYSESSGVTHDDATSVRCDPPLKLAAEPRQLGESEKEAAQLTGCLCQITGL